MTSKVDIEVTVNGKVYRRLVEPHLRLIDFLRDDLRLTGTKEGCGKGECGTCSVILDGLLVNSCLVLAVQADKSLITTIEGVSDGEHLHPIQQAFVDSGAVQCGYCTPGMVLAAKVLLESNPNPTDDEIKRGLAGNLCRCTGYKKIISAVKSVAEKGEL